MTYLVEHERYGRKEFAVDISRFATDLAKLLGGTVEKKGENYDNARDIRLDRMVLSVYGDRYGTPSGKVLVTSFPVDLPPDDRPFLDGRRTYKMPDARVSVSRPIQAIAKDIKRRVIDAAETPLANVRDYVARRQAEREGVAGVTERLVAAVPEMRVRSNGMREENGSRTLDWSGPNNVYLTCHAYASGDVGIDRIGNVPLAAFIEIAEVLRRHSSKKVA